MGYAITTKYLGPTNFKGSRIKVKANGIMQGRSIFVSWDYKLGITENHHAAMAAMVQKINAELAKAYGQSAHQIELDRAWASGEIESGSHVFVLGSHLVNGTGLPID